MSKKEIPLNELVPHFVQPGLDVGDVYVFAPRPLALTAGLLVLRGCCFSAGHCSCTGVCHWMCVCVCGRRQKVKFAKFAKCGPCLGQGGGQGSVRPPWLIPVAVYKAPRLTAAASLLFTLPHHPQVRDGCVLPASSSLFLFCIGFYFASTHLRNGAVGVFESTEEVQVSLRRSAKGGVADVTQARVSGRTERYAEYNRLEKTWKQ